MSEDLLKKYPQVAGDPVAMAMLCGPLVERKHFAEAYQLGLLAVEAAPEDMEVRDLVASALGGRVAHWHIPMLRDERRNRCYARAIEKAVRPGMTILEIGTGAGFLSLTAAAAGARVYTCEADPLVAAAATEIVRRNKLDHLITVIPKASTDLEIGKDLPAPAEMLMSELFDDTLYGDKILSFIADAKQRLLKEDCAVLPPRAELRLSLISLEMPPQRRPLDKVGGFDLSAFNVLSPRLSSKIQCRKAAVLPLSAPASALPADFEKSEPFAERDHELTIRSNGGSVGGIAQWLRIDFGDDIIYENDPFEGSWSHWAAPIYPLIAPLDTAAGDLVKVRVRRVFESTLLISVRSPKG